MKKDNATNIDEFKSKTFEWFLPHYNSSIPQQALVSKQILIKVPAELQFVERSVFMKEVKTQKLRSFELGTQEGRKLPIWLNIGFQQKYRQDSQDLKIDAF